ncbi:MAG: hypothetical protein ABIV93_04330, partial [Byssovorax sp.]
MNVQGTLEIPARRRATGAISFALVLVLASAALFAVQACVDPPAGQPTTPTTPSATTPPPPPTPDPLPPP